MEYGDLKIKVEKLVGAENWRNWKMEVQDALVIKGVYCMVTEEAVAPVDPGEDAESGDKVQY